VKRIHLPRHRYRGERRGMKTFFAESANLKTSPRRLEYIHEFIKRFRVDYYRYPFLYREIQRNIVAHPNVPPSVLFPDSLAIDDRLIATYPDAFLRNPILPLLALEKPDYLQRITKTTLLRLLAWAHVPRSFLVLAFMHEDDAVRDAAMSHVQMAGDVVPESGADERAFHEFLRKLPLLQGWNDREEDL
jgi:hypothetical protein